MGSRLGAVARLARLARLAKTHGSLAPIDPWLTKMMERAVVDVPKGTVVVGDRRRAPRAGAWVRIVAGSRGDGFTLRPSPELSLRPSPEILTTIPYLCAAPCSMSTTLGNRSPHSGKRA